MLELRETPEHRVLLETLAYKAIPGLAFRVIQGRRAQRAIRV